jgi:L-threonylcarbamoyladenylate synthase
MAPKLKGLFTRSLSARVAAALAAGGTAVLPTDTMYGLHCAAFRAGAVKRIRALKRRASASGFILLASDAAMADRLVSRWPGGAKEVLSRVWPAPLTALLPARKNLPAALAPRGVVAVRVPRHAALRALIAAVGEPLVSTSANLAGRRPLSRIADIERAFPGLDAYVSKRGRTPARPSTIVDFTSGRPTLVRPGSIPWPAGSPGGGRVSVRGKGSNVQSGNPSKRRSR